MLRFLVPLLILININIHADECIRAFALSDLTITEGALPVAKVPWDVGIADGEAFTDGQGAERTLLLRIPAPGEIHGVLAIYAEPGKPAQRTTFTIPATTVAAAPDAGMRFRAVQRSWCDNQLNPNNGSRGSLLRPTPDRGSRAWWSLVRSRAGGPGDTPDANRGGRGNDIDQTMDLFTGTTALNENLQFDRTMRINGDGELIVAISSLPTLTTREVPWERMPGNTGAVTLDPLAARIPIDQHALLFPSFDALSRGMSQVDGLLGAPLMAISGRSQDAGSIHRYQRQLGLEMTELAKRFGPQVVEQVAMTGSDPFLRAGTDVALLFRAKQPALLATFLTAKIDLLVQAGAKPLSGSIGTLNWRGALRSDRSVSSYLLVDGDTAVVANSLTQLDAYAAVRGGTRQAVTSAPEFAFFRRRYVHGADGEIALAVISDATIRRWCSAHWRIGDSRRMRAAQLLAGLQAEWVADGAKPHWAPVAAPADLGVLTTGAHGLNSSLYGNLAFLTPVAELVIDKVTGEEAESYKRFHSRYQNQWRDFFDPIALRLASNANGQLSADLSVLPLIVGSEYRQLIRLVGNAKLDAGSGDRHPALIQWALAIDREGEMLASLNRDSGRMLGNLASPFGWVGRTVSVYAEADPFWGELAAQAGNRLRERFFEANLKRLPVGIHIAVADPLRLLACMTALRAMADQSGPGLVDWNSRTWKDIPYVVITPSDQGRGMLGRMDAQICYVALPEGLTLSLNEGIVQRAIDRVIAARTAATAAAGHAPPSPWPGDHAALIADPTAISLLSVFFGDNPMKGWMQHLSWANIDILNEWHRRFPGQDPVAVHERLWGARPLCPGGGTYVWNARWLTMESTVYGNPFDPREGPTLPSALASIRQIAAGMSFEQLPTVTADPATNQPASPGERTYTVNRGDTLLSVATSQNCSVDDLVDRNDLSDTQVVPGQVLVIPEPGNLRPLVRREPGASYGLRVHLDIEPITTK